MIFWPVLHTKFVCLFTKKRCRHEWSIKIDPVCFFLWSVNHGAEVDTPKMACFRLALACRRLKMWKRSPTQRRFKGKQTDCARHASQFFMVLYVWLYLSTDIESIQHHCQALASNNFASEFLQRASHIEATLGNYMLKTSQDYQVGFASPHFWSRWVFPWYTNLYKSRNGKCR